MWFGPSDHVAWRRGNITKKSMIYRRYITDILSPEAIFSKYLRYISPNRYIADILAIFTEISPDISAIFTEISPLRFFFTKYCVDLSRYTIYRRYILTFSSFVMTNCTYLFLIFYVDLIIVIPNSSFFFCAIALFWTFVLHLDLITWHVRRLPYDISIHK